MTRYIEVIYPCEKTVTFYLTDDRPVKELLERVYDMFNSGSGIEHHRFKNMRSLSVNDFVVIDGHFFQCLSFGWMEVDPTYLSIITGLVQVVMDNNNDSDPYFSLGEVMWAVYQ